MKKKLLALVLGAGLCANSFGAGTPVFDFILNSTEITNVLATIDQLYEAYDQTMNQIQMIQQNYERLQFAIEQAATFNFNEIQWDGDLDFRNEIKNATSQVNRQLNNIRSIRNSLTAKTVNIGGQSFSFASLCGINDGNGSLEEMVHAAGNYYNDAFAKAAKTWAEGVSDDDAQRLWARYGLSPANYRMVQDVKTKLNEKLSYLIGSTEEDLQEASKEADVFNETIENLMDMLGKEGATESELAQVNGMLLKQTITQLQNMQSDLKQGMSYMAWWNRYMEQKEEAEAQSRKEKLEAEDKNSIPSYF